MKCPSCGLAELQPVAGADLNRCPNCLWTVTKKPAAAAKKKAKKRTAKKRK